ncbi:MAG: DMT family transporter [Alphaproteobacteria bacterium]|nr:DMT family transporter [Alphaproteobacteria bacterium]
MSFKSPISLKSKVNLLFNHSPTLAIIAALLGSSFIALSPLFVRFSEVGTTATAFYRFFFALPLVWTWMIFDNLKPELHRTPRTVREYVLLIAAGFFLGMDITFWHLAMIKTSVVNAVILNAITPVFVAFASWIFFKEKITLPLGVGIVLALSGSFILVSASGSTQESNFQGDVYALISAVFYAAFMICLKELRKSFSAPTIMFWVALVGMYVLAIIAHFMNEVVVPRSADGWILLVVLALIVHVLGGGLMSYSIGHLSATFSSLTILIGPFVAALLGWVVFSEAMSWQQAIGGITIIAGIVLSRRKRLTFKRKETKNTS